MMNMPGPQRRGADTPGSGLGAEWVGLAFLTAIS